MPVDPISIASAVSQIIFFFIQQLQFRISNNKKIENQIKGVIEKTTKDFFAKYQQRYGGSPDASFLYHPKNVEGIYRAIFDDGVQADEIAFELDFGLPKNDTKEGIEKYIQMLKVEISKDHELDEFRKTTQLIRNQERDTKKLDGLKAQIDDLPEMINSLLGDKLFEKREMDSKTEELLLDCIKESHKMAKYGKVIEACDNLLSSAEYSFSSNFTIEIYCMKGRALLNSKVDNKEVLEVVAILKAIDTDNENKYKFFATVAAFRDKKELLEIVIGWYEKNKPDSNLPVLFEAQYCFFKLDFDKAYSLIKGENDCEVIMGLETISTAYELLGKCYAERKEFDNAIECFEKAYVIEQTWIFKYLILLTTVNKLIPKYGFIASDEDKEALRNCFGGLKELRIYFKNTNDYAKEEFYRILLLSALFTDPNLVVKEIYNELPEDVKKSPNIMKLYSEALQITGDTEEAIENAYKILDKVKNEITYTDLFAYLMLAGRYQEVLDVYYEIDFQVVNDKSGRLPTFPLEAYEAIADLSGAENFINENYKKFNTAPFFLVKSAEILKKIDDNNFANDTKSNSKRIKQFIKEAERSTDKNDLSRLVFAEKCIAMGFNDEAMKMLEPIKEKDETAKGNYLNLEAVKAHNIKNFSLAYLKFKKLYDLRKEISVADKMVQEAIYSNQVDDIDEEIINELVRANTPEYCETVSHFYSRKNDIDNAEKYLFKALSLLGDEIRESVFLSYIGIILVGFSDKKREYNQVENNSCALLRSKTGEEIWIGIYNQFNLNENGELICGSTFYNEISEKGSIIIGKRVNSKVTIDKVEYDIVTIEERIAVCVRYCMSKYSEKFPDSKHFQQVPIDPNAPEKSLIPYLFEDKKHIEQGLDQYNFSDKIGRSIYYLSKWNGKDYWTTISYLLFNKNQQFFTYNIVHCLDSTSKIILSGSSFVILAHLDLLSKIDPSKIFMSKSLKLLINNMFFEAKGDKSSGILGLADQVIPHIFDKTEKEKDENTDIIRKMKLFIDNANVLVYEEVKDYDENIKDIVGLFDYEAVLLAKQNDFILVLDDLYTAKVIKSIYTNFVSMTNGLEFIINEINNIDDRLNYIYKLAEFKYTILYDSEVLEDLIRGLAKKQIKLPADVRKLSAILDISVELKYTDFYYFQHLLSVLNSLYKDRYIPIYNEYIMILVNAIIKFCNNNKIKKETLIGSLEKAAGLDIVKAKYFKNIFS